jgi:hypothetical protein
MDSGVRVLICGILCLGMILPIKPAYAQDPITEVIKAGIKKAIKAVDLQIQRLQNETIRLQNAQKTIENALSQLKLEEITEWVEKQRQLYAGYYEELWQVKRAITYYRQISGIIQQQLALVEEYKRAYAVIRQDKNFTPDEIDYMSKVYAGILDASMQNLDRLFLIVNSFKTQMSDAKRLELIAGAADDIERNLTDLRRFNNSNAVLSLQRTKDAAEIRMVKMMYGLEER